MDSLKKTAPYVLSAVWFLILLSLSFLVPRTNFYLTYGLIAASFACFFLFGKVALGLRMVFWVGLAIRLCLLFSTPELSDDYFRFLWDGALSASGLNPFKYLPKEVLAKELLEPQWLAMFAELNSPGYYSVYPPFVQLVNGVSVAIGGSVAESLVVMKVIFLMGELLSFYFLKEILVKLGRPVGLTFLYWLCPLVVMEFVGNLHFECWMVTFMLGAYAYYLKQKPFGAALMLALAACTKLIPVMFVPLVFFAFADHHRWKFGAYSGLLFGLFFAPLLLDGALINVLESVNLYFTSFEFNSSFYLLGSTLENRFWWFPEGAMKILGSVVLLFSMVYMILKKVDLLRSIAISYAIYLVFSQSIHPWYVLPLLVFYVPGRVPNYVWAWLVLIPLSYITYQTTDYTQQVWVNWVEYLAVFGWMVYDALQRVPKRTLG